MESKRTISLLKAGDSIKETEKMQFMVDDVTSAKDGYILVLTDSTGKIQAHVMDGLCTDPEKLKGKVVTLEGIVLYVNEDTNRIKVKKIAVVDKEDIKISVFTSIPEEKLDRYERELEKLRTHLKGSVYEELVSICFSQARVTRMRQMPATLINHCCIKGGMLEAAVVVARLATETGRYYMGLSNGLYNSKIEWDLLITAALLHNIGNFLYYSNEEPFSKTMVGVNYGYQGCVTEELENVIRTNSIELSVMDKAKLIGVIAQCNPYRRSGAKAMRVEAVILRNVYTTFTMADMFDRVRTQAMEEGQSGEDTEFVYDEALRCYVTLKG